MNTQTTRPLHLPARPTPRRRGPGRAFGIADDLPIPRECCFLIEAFLAIGAGIASALAASSSAAARAFTNFSNFANFAKPPRQSILARALQSYAALLWAWVLNLPDRVINSHNKIQSITDGNLTWSYAYNETDDLTDAYYPDGGHIEYKYEDENSPHYLTSKTNKRHQVDNTFTYDMFGRLKTFANQDVTYERTYGDLTVSEHPTNNVMAVTQRWYDTQGHLTSVREANGRVREDRWDIHGKMPVSLDGLGNEWTYKYDDSNRLIATMDPDGHVTRKDYDSEDHLVVTTDAAGNTTRRGFDDAGNMVITTDPAGNTAHVSYTTSSVVEIVTDPAGHETRLEHDDLARVTAQTRTVGTSEVTVRTQYDGDGNREAVIDPKGATTIYQHDDLGRVVAVVGPEMPAGGTGATTRPVTAMTHDLEGQVGTRTDSLGRTNIASFDEFGNKVSETDALGNVTRHAYSEGQLVVTTDPLGHRTWYEHDRSGRLVKVIDALGGTIEYGYDLRGNRVSAKDPRGYVTLTSFDALNRTTSVTYPDGAVARMAYDSIGNLVRTTDPLGNTTRFEYNTLGQQTARVEPNGDRTEFEYDSTGNRTAVIRATGTSLAVRDEMAYDALGRMTSKTRAVGTANEVTVGYEYDLAGNVTAVVNGRGKRWTFAYDAGNRLTSETDPLGRTRSYYYDTAGHLVEKRDPKGQKIQYDFDALGRCTEARYIKADTSLENVARMSYDAVGNMTRVTDTNVDISQEFDALNRITAINHAHLQKTQKQGWDAAGNRTWMSVDGIPNSTATYGWDSTNRLAAIHHVAMGDVAYTYDVGGRKTTLTYPNGIVCRYYQDSNGRLTALDYRKSNNDQVFFENLTYDARGNITQRVDDEGTHSYQYDWLDQLTRAQYPDNTFEEFAYDKSGNRSSLTTAGGVAAYAVDDADQLLSVSGPGQSEITTFSSTPNGEMESEHKSGQSTRTIYGWDTRSMMTQVSMPDGRALTLTYLPQQWLGWMYRSTGYEGVTTCRIWDAATGNPVGDLGGDLMPVTLHGHDAGMDRPLTEMTVSTGAARVLLADHLGSVQKATAPNGTSLGSQHFTAFGQLRGPPIQVDLTTLGYTGREPIGSPSFLYLRNRLYDPKHGLFATIDPIGLIGHFDTYRYASNTPVMMTDPTGLIAEFQCRGALIDAAPQLHCLIHLTCNTWRRKDYYLAMISYGGAAALGRLETRNSPGTPISALVMNPYSTNASGCPGSECVVEKRLLEAFATAPQSGFFYYPFGVNSNSFAHTLVKRAGASFTNPAAINSLFPNRYGGVASQYGVAPGIENPEPSQWQAQWPLGSGPNPQWETEIPDLPWRDYRSLWGGLATPQF